MGKQKYPIVLPWQKASTENYTMMADTPCGGCGEKLGKKTEFWRRETQVSWLRGDDEVESRCLKCGTAFAGHHDDLKACADSLAALAASTDSERDRERE